MGKLNYTYSKLVLQKVLKNLRDNEDGLKFEGEIKNGKIEGIYSSFPFLNDLNGAIYSYLSISGVFNLNKGELSIRRRPSLFFYLSICIPLIAIIISIRSYYIKVKVPLEDKLLLGFGVAFAIIFSGLFLLQRWLFKSDLETLLNHVELKVKEESV